MCPWVSNRVGGISDGINFEGVTDAGRAYAIEVLSPGGAIEGRLEFTGLRDRVAPQVALAFAAFGAGSMLAAVLLPRLLDRLADRPVMLGGAGGADPFGGAGFGGGGFGRTDTVQSLDR